jgi:hypothetical protein
MAVKIYNHPLYPGRSMNSDNMARISFIFGCMAVLIIGVPGYAFFLALLPGILAIRFSRLSLKNGTRKGTLAGIGKGLGILVLTGLGIEILLAVTIMAIRRF